MGHKLLCLLNGAQIRSDGHLLHRLEAQYLHSRNDLSGSHIFAELPPKSRSNDGNHLVTAADGVDKLEQLSLIHNSAEGAVHQTHTAADALVLVDLRPAVLILADGVHAAGLLTGPLKADDGLIGAGRLALSAFDALALIDLRPTMVKADGFPGAGIGAVVGQTALAGVGHLIMGVRTGVTGIFNNVDQGWFVIPFPNCRLIRGIG